MLSELSNAWNVAVLVILLIVIVWLMMKRDLMRSPGVFPEQEEPEQRDFKQMSLLEKCRLVENKILGHKKDSLHCSDSMRTSLISLRMIKETVELVSAEQLLKCEYAINWMEEPAENRKLSSPPVIAQPAVTFTERDLNAAYDLLKKPIDLRRKPAAKTPGPRRKSRATGNEPAPRIKAVDTCVRRSLDWLTGSVDRMLEATETAREVGSDVIAEIVDNAKRFVDYMRRAVFVKTTVSDDGTTTIIIYFKRPSEDVLLHGGLPVAVQTGPPLIRARGLCCTPVRYEPPSADMQ